jgi:medium-chain acyl-[acyl-carrier-protein] hydrolase
VREQPSVTASEQAREAFDRGGVAPARAVVRLRRSREPRLRLLCLPFAGGGASAFRGWPETLPPGVEVVALQLPGREGRIAEPAFRSLEPVVESLADATDGLLDVPFVLFGHSMGALLAFELARSLRRRDLALPAHLVVSGARAPHLPRRTRELHRLPDMALVAELRRLGGTPVEVLDHDGLLELVLPTLRADLTVCETYVYAPEPPLDCPVSAWRGRFDSDVDERELEVWAEHTSAGFDTRIFPGGHSYLLTARARLAEALVGVLDRVTEPV